MGGQGRSDVADRSQARPTSEEIGSLIVSEVRNDLAQVVALLVDEPRDVVVSESEGDFGPHLEVRVADDDLGKVIGRQGRTARALRCVLAARSTHGERRWDIKILDN